MLYLNIFLLLQLMVVSGEVIVEIKDGKIKGITQQTRNGISYSSFLGIRYGKNPTNELRFQPPKPVDPWDGIFDATQEKGICYQVPQDYDIETEDCLMLNLYSPVINLPENSSAKLPVMFFIHGGGFVEGSGILEWGVGPQFFMEFGVIIVSINYRVGPFGYLATGDTVIPGNNGMKDQILALKWVQKNIIYFGGDPEKVTIFGQSAGSASVSYLLLSPQAKDLFRAAILESGSALSPWAYQRDQINITYQTAGLLNPEFKINNRNSSDLLTFLQSVSAKEIDDASHNLTNILEENPGNLQMSKGFYYTPVIEPQHEEAFLTELQYESFKNGNFTKVPVLIGFNGEEDLFFLSGNFQEKLEAYDSNIKYIVPFDMHVTDHDLLNKIGHTIKQFYTPNKDFKDNTLAGIQYHSNQDFDKSLIKQGELQARYIPVYFYEFTYSGKMGNNPNHLNGSGAVTHGEEQNYLFNRWYSADIPDNSDFTKFPQNDVLVHYRFMTLFTNFAKYLNPTLRREDILNNITWPTVETANFHYLDIGENLIIRSRLPKQDMFTFWNDLYDKYAIPPYDTF